MLKFSAMRQDAGSVSVARVMLTCMSDVNLALGENSKEPSSLAISTKVSFNNDSNKWTLHVNKVCQQ